MNILKTTTKFIAKRMQKIKYFSNWLLDYIPAKIEVVGESFRNLIKKLYNKRDTAFQLKDSRSALKKFAIHYRIDGKDGFDHDLFMDNAENSITDLLINKR